MDIGTAKPTPVERAEVDHHMVDVVDREEDFTVAEFQEMGRAALETAPDALVVGGSGLHFRSLLDPLEFPASDPAIRALVDALSDREAVDELLAADPQAPEFVDIANPRRVQRAVEILRMGGETPSARASSPSAVAVREYRPLKPFIGIGLDPGEGIRERIETRVDHMLAAGLIEEIRGLGERMGRNAAQAVGYKELIPVVAGQINLAEGRRAAVDATAALAKRQRTFFKRDPRIQWLPWSDDPEVRYEAALAVLERMS